MDVLHIGLSGVQMRFRKDRTVKPKDGELKK
jgi:hypothetical protein